MSMPGNWQARAFGPAASTVALAIRPGATLGGIFISAKGASPAIIVYDASASVTGTIKVPSWAPAAVGDTLDCLGGLGMGRGLTVKVTSATGVILWQPPNW